MNDELELCPACGLVRGGSWRELRKECDEALSRQKVLEKLNQELISERDAARTEAKKVLALLREVKDNWYTVGPAVLRRIDAALGEKTT